MKNGLRPKPRSSGLSNAHFLHSQPIENLFVCRKATGIVLAVYFAAVDDDVENAAASLDQLGIDIRLLFDGGRQTGGLRLVVSLIAIGNRNTHAESSVSLTTLILVFV